MPKSQTTGKTIFRHLALAMGLLAFLNPFLILHAATGKADVYGFEVVVANTGKAERDAGIVRGLEQVMVRATGNKRIATHPAAGGLFSKAGSYLQQYAYFERTVEQEVEELDDTAATEAPVVDVFAPPVEIKMETVLKGRFESGALERALRQAGLPVWASRRPIVLMLSSVEDDEGSREGADASIRPVLESAAALRGLPIKLPAEGELEVAALWKGDRFALQDAAEAAGVDYVQWSRVKQQVNTGGGDTPFNWIVEAALYQNGELVREWYFNANSEEQALQRLVDETTDWMAGRYAVVSHSGGKSVIGLHIKGIRGVSDYVRVQKILKAQGALEKVELVAIGHGALIYRVTSRSDARQLERSLGLLRGLRPDTAPSQELLAPVWLGEFELYYRLQ